MPAYPSNKEISRIVKMLMDREGLTQDQAINTASSMYREGYLKDGSHNNYTSFTEGDRISQTSVDPGPQYRWNKRFGNYEGDYGNGKKYPDKGMKGNKMGDDYY